MDYIKMSKSFSLHEFYHKFMTDHAHIYYVSNISEIDINETRTKFITRENNSNVLETSEISQIRAIYFTDEYCY